MSYSTVLKPSRGTYLFRNSHKELNINIEANIPLTADIAANILLINGNTIKSALDHNLDLSNPCITIEPNTEHMIINLTISVLNINYSHNPNDDEILYNPYLFENKDLPNIDPQEFKEEFQEYIPDGYIDTLSKWYSVKYTYPEENLIFIRPGIGISFQTHKLRQEHWKVISGHPIIISGEKIYYRTSKNDEFEHPFGGMHTIINPNEDWVLIKETYVGTFDEKDIVRVFNPNNYF